MTLTTTTASAEPTAGPQPAPVSATQVPREVLPAVVRPRRSGRSFGVLAAVWVLVALFSFGLVLYALEPMFQQQTQSRLLTEYRAQVSQSANQAGTLAGVTVPTQAPELGAPIGILEIGRIRMRQVGVEGTSSAQTQAGPGHVPGTAGPGQPGNSVFVGRRGMFGGPFGKLNELQPDDAILITTTQGQSVYRVTSVAQVSITNPAASSGVAQAAASGGLNGTPETESSPVFAQGEAARLDAIYGPTTEDRLTLVTSASVSPQNSSRATVVIAKLDGRPFAPTPQGGRTATQTGLTGDSGAWASLLLSLQAFVLAAAASVFLYRRFSPRVAYLLTMPALLAFAVLAAEAGSRLLPAWA